MINRIVAAASMAALLAAAPASAQDSHNSAVGPGAGIAALGLTAVFLRSHVPPVIYPAPAVIYPTPPVVAAPPVAAEPALSDLHP